MAQLKRPGKNLKQERRHQQEVVPAHQHDLDVRAALEKALQMAGRINAAKAAAEDHNAFHGISPPLVA